MTKRLENFTYEKRLRELGLLSLEKVQRELIKCIKVLEGRLKSGQCQALLSGAQQEDQWQWEQTETWMVLSEHQETPFYHKGD